MAPTMDIYSRLVLSMLLVGILVPIARSIPLNDLDQSLIVRDTVARSNNNVAQTSLNSGTCQSMQSNTYYGLGVRMGMYFSWVNGWIAFNFAPAETKAVLDTNTIFLLAFIISLVRNTATDHLLRIDALVLLHLSTGTIFGVLSIWGYRTKLYVRDGPAEGISNFGGFGTHGRLLLCVAFASYGVYFWLHGVDQLPPAASTAEEHLCDELYTFMFAKFRVGGAIRLFYTTCTFGGLIYWGIQLLASTLAAYARPMRMIELAKTNQWRTTSRLTYATGFKYKELQLIHTFARYGNVLWIMFSIANLEFTLNFNNMNDVVGSRAQLFTSSQLTPFIIGVCGFFKVVRTAFKTWRSPGKTLPSLARDEPISPQRAATRPHGINVLKAFTPRTVVSKVRGKGNPPRKPKHTDDEMDILVDGQPWHVRYLVAYLPWLVLVRWWKLKDSDYEKFVYEDSFLGSFSHDHSAEPSPDLDDFFAKKIWRDSDTLTLGSSIYSTPSPKRVNSL